MSETLYDGIIVMCLGMGTVLCFLCIMICAMILMSKVVLYLNKIFPEAVEEIAAPKRNNDAGNDAACALAILTSFLKKK